MTERREVRALRGVLLTLAPVTLLLAPWDPEDPVAWGAGATILSLLLAAATLHARDRLPRLLATLGVLGIGVLWVVPRIDRPGWGYVVLLACSGLLARIWPPPKAPARPQLFPSPFRSPHEEARSAAWTVLVAWFIAAFGRVIDGWHEHGALLIATLVPPLLAWPGISAHGLPLRRQRFLLAAALLAPTAALVATAGGQTGANAVINVLSPLAVLLAVRARDENDTTPSFPWATAILTHPPRVLVVTFAAQCVIGGLLLTLPVSTTRPGGVGLIDAMFTAVSATCVTGLTVLDTGSDFSSVGQVVILLLIQVGGLGIMTFSTAAFLAFARRMSLRQEATAADLIGADNVADLSHSLWRVVAVTLAAEGLGAVILTLNFLADGMPWSKAVWKGMFTAISAFCNAGFGLDATNLMPYNQHAIVLHTVASLIVLGGLGPAVIAAVVHRVRARRHLNLYAAIVLSTTALLLVVPTIVFAALEWERSLAGLPFFDKWHNAWFQSVTTRTAGFNSVDLTLMQPATVTMFIVLMFIGGSPGSTAGGAKTTTIALLALAVGAAAKGHEEVTAFRRRVPHATIYRAGAVATLCAAVVLTALLLLQVTQAMPSELLLFEAVSAMGTVGLTIGVTPNLDDFGKVVIMACMFAGRVGPLTLLLLLDDVARPSRTRLPEENVPVG